MISTGAFQTEMDASNKQKTLAEKFAAVWEKKNAKAARAGGVSLMALSLAACGSDDAATTDTGETSTVTTSSGSALTVNVDTITATGDVTAARDYTPGGNDLVNTLQTDDVITGTEGTAQKITITFGNNNDAGAATVAPTMTDIETVVFKNVSSNGAVDTLDMGAVDDLGAVEVTALDDGTVIRGMDTLATLKAYDVSDETTSIGFEFDDTTVVGTTAVSLTVDGFAGNEINVGAAATDAADGTGVETLTITSSGDASTIANLGSTGVTTLNVSAGATLTLTALAATGITTVNLVGSSADTSINVAANVNANEFGYTGGDGNDTLIATTGFAGTDSLDAGAGTADVLSIRATADVAAVGALSAASATVAAGWDTLDMRGTSITGAGAVDFTVDMDHVPGVTAITMRAGDDDTKSIFTLNDLTAGQAGALTMTHTGTAAATDSEIIVDMKTNGTDTVDLTATVTADTQVVELNDANNNIENVEVTLAGAFTTNLDIDVSSFTTSVKVDGGAAGETLTITNAHTATTLDMSGAASDVTATLGAGTQTASFGSGGDTITSAAGVKTVTLGAGNDTFNTSVAQLGTAAASWDTVNAGDGTDTLNLTTIAAVTAEAGTGLTGFERLDMTDAAATAITMNLAAFGSTFSRVTVGDTNNALVTITNVATGFRDLRFDAAAETDTEAALERTIDSAANELDITIAGGETIKVITANDEETVNFAQTGTGNVVVSTLNVTDATAMTIAQAGDFTITNALSATSIASVNASAATGAVNLSAANSTVAITATGNTLAGGVFTFTGGSGADTITGGLAADVLVGGLGADTFVGNGAIDTMTGGGGNDTYTGGAGADIYIVGAGSDTITDFAVGAANDDVHLDLSDLEAQSGSDLVNVGDAGTTASASVAHTDTITYNTITGATDLDAVAAAANVLVLNGASVGSTSELETALETGGAFALTMGNDNPDAGDAFLVLYDNGANSYLATVEFTATVADNGLAASGALIASNAITFTGIADCTTIVAANFADIIA